jgi:hypothetical protein
MLGLCGGALTALEVKIGRARESPPGMAASTSRFPSARRLLVGGDGIPVEELLRAPTTHRTSS